MAKVRKCDICEGEIYIPDFYARTRIPTKYFKTKIIYDDGRKIKMDWCDHCMTSFKFFLKNEKFNED